MFAFLLFNLNPTAKCHIIIIIIIIIINLSSNSGDDKGGEINWHLNARRHLPPVRSPL